MGKAATSEAPFACPFEGCTAGPWKLPMHLGAHLKAKHPETAVEAGLGVEMFTPPEKPGLKHLDWMGNARSSRNIRGIKLAEPDCIVFEDHGPASQRESIAVTGPCKRRRDRWYETCTHGHPTADEIRLLGYKGYPAYFNVSRRRITEEQTILNEQTGDLEVVGQKVKIVKVITPNIMQKSASIRNSGGVGPLVSLDWGGLPVQDLGIAPFCDYWDCWNSRSVNDDGLVVSDTLTKYTNGMFCSDLHSILIYADQYGIIQPLDTGSAGAQRRREWLADLRTKVRPGGVLV